MKKQFKTTKQNNDDRGLINGYKPNHISLWIVMLTSGRYEYLLNDAKLNTWLHNALYEAMEPYKLNNQ